jgi:predicted AAA+ superfamily ATPase
MIQRPPYSRLWRELSAEKAMVFLAGPRQAGKTTFAKACAASFSNSVYFNWDIASHKALLVRNPTFFTEMERKDDSAPMVILDEIHKYSRWKNYLKGVYDEFHESHRFLVSGSGRLDLFQRGGDSLAGRYLLMHLWPLTVAELGGRQEDLSSFVDDPLAMPDAGSGDVEDIWLRLQRVSGFPEPYLTNKAASWRRWSDTYGRQVLREDIRDLVVLNNMQGVETLFALLPFRVGSPLSLNALAEDLKVSFNTVKSWLDVMERFFLMFRIPPWTASISRAIRKERKLYLLNVPLIEDPGARFENAVAMELFRAVTQWNESGRGPFALHYVRNKDKEEVDFLLAYKNRPFLLIECKMSDDRPSSALCRFQARLDVPAVQLVNEGTVYRRYGSGRQRILVAPAARWLACLP